MHSKSNDVLSLFLSWLDLLSNVHAQPYVSKYSCQKRQVHITFTVVAGFSFSRQKQWVSYTLGQKYNFVSKIQFGSNSNGKKFSLENSPDFVENMKILFSYRVPQQVLDEKF